MKDVKKSALEEIVRSMRQIRNNLDIDGTNDAAMINAQAMKDLATAYSIISATSDDK